MSSLKNCLRQKEAKLPSGRGEPELNNTHLMQSQTAQGWGQGILAEDELAEVREAHQRALATTVALEEKTERLNQSITRGWLDAHTHSQSHE